MATAVPKLTHYRAHFQKQLNLNGGTLKQLARKQREIPWTPELYQKWLEFLQELYSSAEATLANYDPRKGIVLLIDASEDFWALNVC